MKKLVILQLVLGLSLAITSDASAESPNSAAQKMAIEPYVNTRCVGRFPGNNNRQVDFERRIETPALATTSTRLDLGEGTTLVVETTGSVNSVADENFSISLSGSLESAAGRTIVGGGTSSIIRYFELDRPNQPQRNISVGFNAELVSSVLSVGDGYSLICHADVTQGSAAD
jgi:hypothetical protein